ncbi:MAG TPA: nucleotide exchange factor GrpE [Dehalococcoidia bacterium]|nr:nucleotide exchange factor GrpE [Dehalococcoidia bacterium]
MDNKEKKLTPDEEAVEPKEDEEIEAFGDMESLKEELKEEKEKAAKYLANWQRAEADFINYKKRSEQERAETAEIASAALIKELLPVLDDLERALGNVSRDFDGPTWVEGIKLIYRKLKAVLEERGLAEIVAEGEEFDPNIHEAVMCVEGEEGKVCEEIQKGYKFRDRLLRPSMVKVGKEEESA